MTFLEKVVKLAKAGFHLFPLIPNSKNPALPNFPVAATRDLKVIRQLFWDPVLDLPQPFNFGISTTHFGSNESLLVVDVDVKKEKKGDENLLKLELEGYEFPKTFTNRTPTGGAHLVYRVASPVRQGTNVFADGLDVRSKGGYIVGPFSRIQNAFYEADWNEIVPAPSWMIEWCGRPKSKQLVLLDLMSVNGKRAVERAIYYLENEAPISVKGQGGDQTAYRVAARLKDLGLKPEQCLDLMLDHWNDRCPPGWSPDRLKDKIDHAFQYGTEPRGVAAPELQFETVAVEESVHPFKKLNQEFAFVLAGGGSHILWETIGPKGEFKLEHVGVPAFHQKWAASTMTLADGKTKSLSELWMRSPERRSYDGICFMPGLESPPRFYNLWRGFSVKPTDPSESISYDMKASVDAFLSHLHTNVCHGDQKLARWLTGYFAHIVQKPWEKPLVALVFKGNKGVGKNALIDRIGSLLGSHYLLTSNRRFLTGNFNAHLENLLLFALDEAFWSGDKQAEGTLKDLITGKTHFIEHKGREPYTVENCTRICIIGNEEWLVPASQDERRYAVFDVGEGRKQDRSFFQLMRERMEAGGSRYLLRHLLDFDLRGVDVNAAPSTAALHDQKISSLLPFHQWWLDCLTQSRLVGSDFNGWPLEVEKERLRQAFSRYTKERQIRSRIPEDRTLGKLLKTCAPTVDGSAKRRTDGELINLYRLPDLEQARLQWSEFIGHPIVWE
jgi:hypothetical protein